MIATEEHMVPREVADVWQVMSGSSDQLKIRMLLSDHAAIGATPLKCVIVLRRRTFMAGHLEGVGDRDCRSSQRSSRKCGRDRALER